MKRFLFAFLCVLLASTAADASCRRPGLFARLRATAVRVATVPVRVAVVPLRMAAYPVRAVATTVQTTTTKTSSTTTVPGIVVPKKLYP